MRKKIFKLKNLAYLSILAMPLYLIKISFLGLPTNLFEILALLTIGLFLMGTVGSEKRLEQNKEYLAPIVMIVCGITLSMLCSDSGSYARGWGILKGWFVVPIIFSWVCVQIFSDKKVILRALYGSVFLVACFSMGYFFHGSMTFDSRLQAFYNSPNFLAMYLAPAIIIGVFLFEENRKFYLASLAVIMFSFYQTQSYGAWLAIFAALLFLFIINNEKYLPRWKKIAVVMFIIGAAFLLQRENDKLHNLLNMEERSSASSRIMIWSSAIRIGLDNPILGIGPGNFQNKYLEYQKHFSPYLEWAVPQPHNLFIAVWLQAGLLGLLGFLWLIFLWVKEFVKLKEWHKEDFIFLGIMAYIFLHGMLDTTYFKNDLAVVFWLIIFSAKKHSLGIKKVSD